MPDFYEKRDGKYWADSKKKESASGAEKNVSAAPADMTAPAMTAPVVNPGAVTTAAPIVQPLVIVPYSSQMQPLYQYAAPNGYADETDYDDFDEEPVAKKVRAERYPKKGANGGAIAATIFGLLLVIFVAVTYFVSIAAINLNVTETESALHVIISTVKDIIGGQAITLETLPLFEIGLAVALVFGFLTLLTSVFSFRGKYPVVGKIFGIIALIGAIFMVVIIFVKEITVGYGAYVVAGLTVLIAISAIAAKRKQKRR